MSPAELLGKLEPEADRRQLGALRCDPRSTRLFHGQRTAGDSGRDAPMRLPDAKVYRRTKRGVEEEVRLFRPAEDEMITRLRIEGWGTTDIARYVRAEFGIKRSAATINMRLKSLAAIEEKDL